MDKQTFLDKYGDTDVFNITLANIKDFLPEELDIDNVEEAEELAEDIAHNFKTSTHTHYGTMLDYATVEALIDRDDKVLSTETLKRKRENTGSAHLRDKIDRELEDRGELEERRI